MPTEPQPVTLAQIVHRAAEVVDPNGDDPDVTDLLARFEDADQPVTAVADVEQRLAEAAGARDPQQDAGALQVAVAVATYLAYRRDELADDPDELVRLAVRSEFESHRPQAVTDWLALNELDV
jgi:hypothetical protein